MNGDVHAIAGTTAFLDDVEVVTLLERVIGKLANVGGVLRSLE